MCGRNRQRGHPGMFGPPAIMGARGGCGNDFTYGRGFGHPHHHHGGCHPRHQRQTLTGLAIGAIATAIENKNEQRNARAAALSREVSMSSSNNNEADAITPAHRSRQEYQPTDLDGLVRDLSLSPSSEKNKPEQQTRAAPLPPPVHEDEPPPAYTPTATPTASHPQPTVRSAPKPEPESTSVPTLKLASPLFQTHATHSLIVADQHTLSTALSAYHARKCGRKAAVTRARKVLSRDLGMLEADRLRELKWGRKEIKRAVRAEQGRLKGEVRALMRA